jgi:hypothetical protein
MKHFILILLILISTEARSQNLVPYREGNLWGYRDTLGSTRINAQYQYAGRFRFGMAIVGREGFKGAIDTANRHILPVQYEYLAPLDSLEFLFGYRAKYLGEHIKGVITKYQETKIPAEYSAIFKRQGLYTVVKPADSVLGKSGIYVTRSSRSFYGLLDSNANAVIPCNYSYLDWRNDSLVVLTSAEQEPRQALFNAKGEQLTPFDYMVIGKFYEGLAKARIGDKFGFLFPSGKVAIPVVYDFCENFDGGYAIIKQQDKWGALDKTGKLVVEAVLTYDEVKAQLKEKYGVVQSAPLF